MASLIGDLLPLALGVAISPIPIIAIILMLITPKARSNGTAFLVGWSGAIAVEVALVVIAFGAAGAGSSGSGSTNAAIRLVLGVLLLVMAVRQWRSRPAPGETPAMPKWMSALDAFSPGRSLGMAALLAGVNPKNLLLNLAAADLIAASALTASQQAVTGVVYVVLASLTIAAPLVVYLGLGARAGEILAGWKDWLVLHNSAVMAILFVILGASLVGKGLGGLG